MALTKSISYSVLNFCGSDKSIVRHAQWILAAAAAVTRATGTWALPMEKLYRRT